MTPQTTTCPYCTTRAPAAFPPCVCGLCGAPLAPRPSVPRLVYLLRLAREHVKCASEVETKEGVSHE